MEISASREAWEYDRYCGEFDPPPATGKFSVGDRVTAPPVRILCKNMDFGPATISAITGGVFTVDFDSGFHAEYFETDLEPLEGGAL